MKTFSRKTVVVKQCLIKHIKRNEIIHLRKLKDVSIGDPHAFILMAYVDTRLSFRTSSISFFMGNFITLCLIEEIIPKDA